jgi:hypothetical protein
LKFNPDQPRVPAGSGRENGRWTSDVTGSVDAAVIPVNFRTRQRIKALRDFIEWLRSRLRGSKRDSSEKAPPASEREKPEPKSPSSAVVTDSARSRPKPSDFVGQDFGKLAAGIEKPSLEIMKLIHTPSREWPSAECRWMIYAKPWTIL